MGAPPPNELKLKWMIAEFGTQAVMNRNYLGAGEINRMKAAENVVNAYRQRNESQSWAQWSKDNPEAHSLLIHAQREAERLENDN